MKNFQRKGKGKETEELYDRFKDLEQEWEAFKESKPTKVSHKHILPSNQTIHKYSPRELMFNLQRESPSPTENVTRVNDVAVQEILQERREAIQRGKLKGRRLFQDESSTNEERSMSFYNSEDESSGTEGVHHCCNRQFSNPSSSSSSCLVADHKDIKVVANLIPMIAEIRVVDANVDRRGNGRTSYAVFLGGVAIILLLIAMFLRSAKSAGADDYHLILVPT
ncbi:hypothetical protein VNO78_02319 [Psophocarpus tetragonolobus]|uniref:Uncharacterized protein n=1 Tax=Psophocarpus tetragonolobus TaxID=3891 RepID=A0AAN9SZA3_PSOTE